MMVLRFSMQGEDIFELTNGTYHVFTFYYAREKKFEYTNGKCHIVYTLVNL